MKLKRNQQSDNRRRFNIRVRPWVWLTVLVLAVGGLLAFAAQGQVRAPGILVAESTLQDAGEVSMHGGLITATFPLTVEGETRVTGITTS
jgi:hypothetical protein